MNQAKAEFLLTTRSLPQHRSRDVPRLRRNILHLCAECFTLQCVHFHAEMAISFLDMTPEGIQKLVVELLGCGDDLGKSISQDGYTIRN